MMEHRASSLEHIANSILLYAPSSLSLVRVPQQLASRKDSCSALHCFADLYMSPY